MPMNRVQFQPGVSLPEFFSRYGTEQQCEAALIALRWPDGFRCPRCASAVHYVVGHGARKLFQCHGCRHQTSLTAGTMMDSTKLQHAHLVPGDLPDQPAQDRPVVAGVDASSGHELPHCLGALNRPLADNLGPDGRFNPAAELRADFDRLLAARDPAAVVHHCGSGVSAIPNLLAMEVAGLGPTALFAGSWSEWCSDPGRPVERG